jgi:transcriptional regulator with XRE-family HTH domain
MANMIRPVGVHLREWRRRRRMSQLELACEADISSRHLSFLETGRSRPSREMILHLAEQLEVPMRERNVLLVAAGYAPVFPERALDDPSLNAARHAIDLVLEGQKPFPAFAIDRHWRVVASNAAIPQLYEGAAPHLLEPPINGLRLSLHPQGLAPRIANLGEWRAQFVNASSTADRPDRRRGPYGPHARSFGISNAGKRRAGSILHRGRTEFGGAIQNCYQRRLAVVV